MNTSVTSSALRAANRRRVLYAVYQNKEISKQGLAQNLGISLPTVTQNLHEWETIGLVERKGLYESTGGRKAHIYRFVATAHVAIGIVLLKDFYRIVAVDLYGEVLQSSEISQPFIRNSTFFYEMGKNINEFIERLHFDPDRILGVCIALQGLVSSDGNTVIYGEILNCTGLTLDEIKVNIQYPCTLIHDTEASATAELWAQKDLKDAVLLSLTRNFGGALITNGTVHRGLELSSGIIEHMCLYPHGRPCYCGKHGCIEAYCSAYALQCDAGEPLELFFESLRAGDDRRLKIWHTYLQNLAIAINNIRMVLDSEYVIGGYLLRFMNDDDFAQLSEYAEKECPFQSSGIHIKRSVYLDDAAAPGAAISLVKNFWDKL
ncbi:MAG: ROK family transcriptional regulator [Lachnospiraceae bacterium]|nr:ROK family transcriptional regulator [Lachnospiraceae bacterium]